jgi:Domain of unknown function (DUF4189)
MGIFPLLGVAMSEDSCAVRWGRWSLAVFGIAVLVCAASRFARAQDDGSTEVVPGMEDACIENFGYVGCNADGMPKPPGGGQQLVVVHYAAVAISPTTMMVGGSHGQNSQSGAEQTALQNCRRGGATDCKKVTWAANLCIGLAESVAEKAYGAYVGNNRDQSAAGALALCQSGHGKSCVTVTAPCAADDIRWSSPLPLPPGGTTAAVDPNMVGTWELFINPGRWVWRVAPNGTYELHSEAMDNTPSNAGTFAASNGRYTLHAITMPWDDAGTYKVQSPGVVVATGKLGTGTWKKIGGASNNVTKAPAPARQTGPPISIRK